MIGGRRPFDYVASWRIGEVKQIPPGKILVHNRVSPAKFHGLRGSRWWWATATTEGDIDYEPCDCGWADHLPQHFKVAPKR
jgi:hypothetical protein